MSFIIGIDATNISSGGGVTHLVELLNSVNPVLHGFSHIFIWSGKSTLNRIQDKPWIIKMHSSYLDMKLPFRIFFQQIILPARAKKLKCSVLFVPGGTFLSNFHPFVVMSQNLLPFELKEMKRYGFSFNFLKFFILRLTQSKTFSNADGVIFLTKYAMKVVNKNFEKTKNTHVIIPHGIDGRFYHPPCKQKPVTAYTIKNPFRILYISIIDVYKHQWNVSNAVSLLRNEGFPVQLTLVGPSYLPALKRLNKTLKTIHNSGDFIRYLGAIPFNDLHNIYRSTDIFIFASSCENLPNILLEGMASGLPIACSNYGPMPEVLGDAGVYFDPEKIDQIADSIKMLFLNPELRYTIAKRAYEKSKRYTWESCANGTINFISQIIDNGKY